MESVSPGLHNCMAKMSALSLTLPSFPSASVNNRAEYLLSKVSGQLGKHFCPIQGANAS